MWIIVTYDVVTETPEGRRRLRQVAQVCKAYGPRVQKSVFECSVTETQFERMKARLRACINEDEDSLRLYHVPGSRQKCVEEFGVAKYTDFEEPLVV